MTFELTESNLKSIGENLLKLYYIKRAGCNWFNNYINKKYEINKEVGLDGAIRTLTGSIISSLMDTKNILARFFHSKTAELIFQHLSDEITLINLASSKLKEAEDMTPNEFTDTKQKVAYRNLLKEVQTRVNNIFTSIKGDKDLYKKLLKEDILNETNAVIGELEKLEIKPQEIIDILETLKAEKPILQGLSTSEDINALNNLLISEAKEIKSIRGNERTVIQRAIATHKY